MEKEELLEREEEVEETTLLVRKSRTENGTKDDFDEVSEITSNGHTLHSEVTQNGAESEEETPAEEQEVEKINGVLEKEPEAIDEGKTLAEEQEKIEKINGVLEKEPEAINGEQASQNLVFHDNVEADSDLQSDVEELILLFYFCLPGGIWKCRLCSWTHRNGSVCVDHFQNHKGQFHKLMNLKTFNFQSKGLDSSTFTYLKEKQILKEPESKEFNISSLDFVVQSNSTSTLYSGEIENNSISSSIFKPPQVSAEIEGAAAELINEEDLEVAEFDVERVIQKQTSHDLFCPNCNSCITKRVILRKRKRRIRIHDEEFEQNISKTARGPELAQSHGDQVDNDAEITPADEDERYRGPHVFRCFSCFSFFIPTGDGLKCLPIKEWFASMFTPNRQGPVVEQGSISQTVVPRGGAITTSSNLSDQPSLPQNPRSPANVSEGRVVTIGSNHTWEGGDEISPLLNQKPSVNGNVGNHKLHLNETVTIDNHTTVGLFDSYTQDQVVHKEPGSDLSVTTHSAGARVPNWKSVKDAIVFSQGGKLPISANIGSSTLVEPDEIQLPNHPEDADKEVIHQSPTSISVVGASNEDGKLNIISVSIPHEQHIHANISSSSGHVHNSEGSQHIIKTNIEISNEPPKVDNISVVKDGAVAPDMVINIDSHQPTPSQTVQGTIHPPQTPNVPQSGNQIDSERTEARREYKIEVVKSIVYGGLAQSITSLSVVSSAAGGGAATLNVLALAAANLIGGLFIICHNLWELRYHQTEQVSNQINEQPQDRYKELLGRRESFILHAVVAIISYMTFGIVPPLVYSFAYRISDDRQMKLVVLAAVSLFCILILATAKAYTQRRPKPYVKTIATYVVLGFMVSGVAYVAGELVERLLNELGLFQTSSVPDTAVSGMKPTGSGWASY